MAAKTKNERIRSLIEIGNSLSSEHHIDALLEKILRYAMSLTHADGGTLYTVTPQRVLHFEIVFNDSLRLHWGGTSKEAVAFSDLPLFSEEGRQNTQWVVAAAALRKKTFSVPDVYLAKEYDFSGAREFDNTTGYRTQSILAIPIKDRDGHVTAVFQLINRKDPETGQISAFTVEDQQLAESLASQAGIALVNQRLIDSLQELFESFIAVIAEAIDEKSPSTANHGKRVPVVAQMLAQAVNDSNEGPFKDTYFSDDQMYELKIASFLHDCGKITTPSYLEEKRTKLETVCDRMNEISVRFEVLRKDAELQLLRSQLDWYKTQLQPPDFSHLEQRYHDQVEALNQDESFLLICNEKESIIDSNAQENIRRIGKRKLGSTPLLDDHEIKSLSVERGNLTDEERRIIQNHVLVTYRMLMKLKYPKKLQGVPEIAAYHHERMDGRGYPFGKKESEMPLRSRILAIADVFEALSAPDRAYKTPYPLSKVVAMMQAMADEGHLDPLLFDVFLQKKVYLEYGRRYLQPEQIDL